ncbi:signal transduction histidine kinase [Cytobacillus firmus]|uniref:histidine kinase n=2 Tax=Cytobacillus TaxID=2675230 RepID=A0A366JIV1_CYTFI|nr:MULTISPECIES: HAMP domain-containing sensor histidine kinase [Cytobacillus]RBP87057.1 signal transduction histidine kinase [Cytobacillus firmus]TDX46974.1 signal transduction histidine kinase [Cytobacillus oceanisediminis]
MKFLTNSLAKKMWLTVTAAIIITILYSYFLSYLFYEKIYVENVRESLLTEGRSLSSEYKGGPLTEDLREKIDWYNSKAETEVFIVSNPRELSACLPFEIDYQTLIGEEEREELLKGSAVEKLGYEKRFDRKIMGVIIPLLDDNRLQGIIYLYVPLAKISEITQDFAYLWFAAALIFTVISIILGTMLVKKLTKPLLDMKDAADHVSKGYYDIHLNIDSKDEIGQLASAFNHMSSSIQKEDEKKKDFLANVSHELRTPISYVKGYSEALISEMAESEEDRQKYLQLIIRESKRMERLVGDLLDLSKLESDEYKLEKMPLPLGQLIEDAIEKYKPILREKNLDLQYRLDPEVIINGDEGRIEQIIQNIMDNSIRYTGEGRIRILLSQEKDKCVIEIEDTGIGISEEHLSKIKHRFYRVNKGRTRSDGGTGLGLAIAEKLVKLHQGELTVLSELNKGTTVKIVLPLFEIR